MSDTVGDEILKRCGMKADNKLDYIEWKAKLQQFSIIQLMLLREMIEEVRIKYDMEMFMVGQEATSRRIRMDDYIEARIRALEEEIDFQEKQQEENSKGS